MALPTANAIAQALLGTVVPTTLRNNPLMVEVFTCVGNLLLNDHVAAGFAFHVRDVENLGDEVVLKGDALTLEIGVTNTHMTAGLLANLPVLILLDSQFKPGSYACTTWYSPLQYTHLCHNNKISVSTLMRAFYPSGLFK